MKPPFVRSPYNYDMEKAGTETGIKCEDKSLAQQQFAAEADINTIVKRFNLTGQLPENIRMPQYGDYSGVYDFHTAMNAVALANEAFDAMPANVRARFNNDPAQFVDFCLDDKNLEEATKLGLVHPDKLPPTPLPDRGEPTPQRAPDKGEPAPAGAKAPAPAASGGPAL